MIQAYSDMIHGYLIHASTVERVSQRLLLSIHAMDLCLQYFTQDVSETQTIGNQ